jgi:hypothetical protein
MSGFVLKAYILNSGLSFKLMVELPIKIMIIEEK